MSSLTNNIYNNSSKAVNLLFETNNIYNRKSVSCQSLLPGLGKTFMSLNKISEKFLNNTSNKIIYSAPTTMLLDQVYNDLLMRGINSDDIIFLSSINNTKTSIKKQIRDSKLISKNRMIVLVTHVSYLNFYEYFKDFDIKIFDEEIESAFEVFQIFMNINGERELFNSTIDFDIIQDNPKLCKFKLKDKSVIKKTKNLSYNSMNYYFYQYLNNDVFDLYGISDTLVDFIDGKRDNIIFFKLAKPKVFESNQETIYLGYDVHNSMSSIVSNIINNIEFVDNIEKTMIRKDYSNNFTINYFYEDIFGNTNIKYTNQDYLLDIQKSIKTNNLVKDSLYVWQYDLSDSFKNYLAENNAIPVPAKPHGMNDPIWMSKKKVVIAANYKITPIEKIVCEALDIPVEKFIEARHINMIIQIIARSELRKNDNVYIEIVVMDQDTAERVANKLSNGKNKITLNYLGLKKKEKKRKKENKNSKASIYAKIIRLKKKEFLTEKQKLKLLSLQTQYDSMLVRAKRKK